MKLKKGGEGNNKMVLERVKKKEGSRNQEKNTLPGKNSESGKSQYK